MKIERDGMWGRGEVDMLMGYRSIDMEWRKERLLWENVEESGI